MANYYGERYIEADDFIKYCQDLNIKTDKPELEYYEKAGIMLPVARLIFPEEYVRLSKLYSLEIASEPPQINQWPDLQRAFDKPRYHLMDYADLKDEELIDSFDREMGKNSYLVRPAHESYKPWDSYSVVVPYGNEQQILCPTADHYYSYWQVHWLYLLQQYPDLYENIFLLNHIPDEIKQRFDLVRTPSLDLLRDFKGLSRMFDALSFWITMYHRERMRTFANIPAVHRVQRLDAGQHQAYLNRLDSNSRLVQTRYGLTIDDLYWFLQQLMMLYDDYQEKERFKLSEEIRNDIYYQANLIEALTGSRWEGIAEELNGRYGIWVKEHFRYLNLLAKERDESRDLLAHYTKNYGRVLSDLKIPAPTRSFSATEIDELLDYCERKGFSILSTALSGLIAIEKDRAKKFRRVSQYINIKNVLTALEYILKEFTGKGGTLTPTILEVLKKESWMPLFKKKINTGIMQAENSTGFLAKLNQLLQDPDLVQSEDAYWARVFLIAALARNLTVHLYPNDDWFYGDLFGELQRAAIYTILYSWQVAKREGWA